MIHMSGNEPDPSPLNAMGVIKKNKNEDKFEKYIELAKLPSISWDLKS